LPAFSGRCRFPGAAEPGGLDYVTAAVNSAAGRVTVSVSAPVPAARLNEAAEQAGYGADP
jgi:hypothetical protein